MNKRSTLFHTKEKEEEKKLKLTKHNKTIRLIIKSNYCCYIVASIGKFKR